MDSASIQASAPGKVILFGEHAVVYGRPAIAVPVTQVRACTTCEPAAPGSGLTIVASDLEKTVLLDEAPADDPLAAAVRLTLDHLAAAPPDAVLTIQSAIPIASGLGSGAAVSTALVRALAGYLGHELSAAEVSAIVFEVEKIHHGTPSGIDNTVVAYEQPVYFVRERSPRKERLAPGVSFELLIADTGVPSPTRRVVEDVRRSWRREPSRCEALFDQMAEVADEARRAIEEGDVRAIGRLMDENHELLVELGVSSLVLNRLVGAACFAGALGAKLSGAGRGGNMIALVDDESASSVEEALREAGAVRVLRTRVQQGE